jgi:hypothetical protein
VLFAVGDGKFYRLNSNLTFGCRLDMLLTTARRRVPELSGVTTDHLTIRVVPQSLVPTNLVDNGAAVTGETLAKIKALPSLHIMGATECLADVVARLGLAGCYSVLMVHADIEPGGPNVASTAAATIASDVFGKRLVCFYLFFIFYNLCTTVYF